MSERVDQCRCYTEDYTHENGYYSTKCNECGNEFYGHKHRFICKLCNNKKNNNKKPIKPTMSMFLNKDECISARHRYECFETYLANKYVINKDKVNEEKLRELINSRINCPYCDNVGYTLEGDYKFVTKDMSSDACDPLLEGSIYCEPKQLQCEFCYCEENSKFNLAKAIMKILEEGSE